MSSLRVRAQNKLLNKLGAAKPSKNVQFDTAHANFEKTHSTVVTLETALRGFIVSLKGFHVSAQVLYTAIEAMGNTPENTPEMKQTVAELRSAFTLVDVKVLEDSTKTFETRVMRPATGWMGRATVIKNQVAEFHEEKLVYDHYTRKVMALRESRDKRSTAGKNEKPKDVEKLVRNEQKLAASTNAYSKLSDTTVASLRDFVNTREATLAPIVQRVLEFRVQYAARVADESRVFQKMAHHDSAFDAVLGALESFAAQFTTGGGSSGDSNPVSGSSSSSAAPVQNVPDVPVKALSFECFVGEAPPPLPVTATSNSPATTTSNEWLPPDMPPLPPPRDTNSGMAPPTTPPSANPFFGSSFAASPPSSPHEGMTLTGFQTAPPAPPEQQHMPMPPSSPTSASSFTPWDDIPPPPPAPPSAPQENKFAFGGNPLAAMQFHTMPASPTAPPASNLGWDSFDDMGDFQKMRQQNAMP